MKNNGTGVEQKEGVDKIDKVIDKTMNEVDQLLDRWQFTPLSPDHKGLRLERKEIRQELYDLIRSEVVGKMKKYRYCGQKIYFNITEKVGDGLDCNERCAYQGKYCRYMYIIDEELLKGYGI
jgi:hypothetical protein